MGLLRLLLAIAVIAGHGGPILGQHLCGAGNAVRVFFAISGFYMALILNTKYKRSIPFYRARAIRLYPLYWITLVFAILTEVFRWCLRGVPSRSLELWVRHPLHGWQLAAVIFSNLTFIGSNVLVGFPASLGQTLLDYQFVRQSWSLGAEILFYLSAPLIVRRPKVILAAIGLSFVLFILFQNTVLWEFFEFQWPLFLAGAFVWHISKYLNRLAILTPVCWIFILFDPHEFLHCVPFYLLFVLSFPALFKFTNRHGWDRLIGELSYPVYLLHWSILPITIQLKPRIGDYGYSVVSVCSIVLAGALLYQLDVRIQAKAHGHTVPVHPSFGRAISSISRSWSNIFGRLAASARRD